MTTTHEVCFEMAEILTASSKELIMLSIQDNETPVDLDAVRLILSRMNAELGDVVRAYVSSGCTWPGIKP